MKNDATIIYNHMQEEENETAGTNNKMRPGSLAFIVEELLILSTLFLMLEML